MRHGGFRGIGFAAALTALAGCRASITIGGRAEEEFNESAAFEDVGSLEVDWRNGAVTVRFDDTATQITARGTKVVLAASPEAAEAAMDQFSIEWLTRESFPLQLVLRFDAPQQNATYRADVEVVVPAAVALTITSDDGNVEVDGNQDDTAVNLDNGSVTVEDQRGPTTVVVDTGDVQVTSRDGGVDVQVDTGRIDLDARPLAEDAVRARTQVGAVVIRVPADFAASLQLEADVGLVSTDLSEFTVTNLVSHLRSVSATLNGGGGRITGTSDVGNVLFSSLD